MNPALHKTEGVTLQGTSWMSKEKNWFVVLGEVEVHSSKAYRRRGRSQQVMLAG